MNNKSNYEKMLSGEYYSPDEELADMAYQCSKDLIYINSLITMGHGEQWKNCMRREE